jgi:hypothetical protein
MPTVFLPNVTVTLVVETCYRCGVVFGMPTDFKQQRLKDRESFYCPNGHGQVYTGKTEEQKLRDQLAAEKHAREQADANAKYLSGRISALHDEKGRVERKLRGTRAVVTRMKRRAVAGRCPCCSDQFKDLERHMKTKHPNFDPEKGAEALAEKA